MKFKNRTGITWTNLELTGLLEDEDSCVYLEKVQKHLGLHPFHLTDLNTALHELLNKNLNCYDQDLNGLVLAYTNLKLLSPYGDILYDTHFVHVDIEADFFIFRPEVSKSLKGFVNKKSTNHLGILVHKAFNVSVPKPESDENGEYMEEGETEWLGDNVKVGQEVRFTPDIIELNSKLPYIRGSLHEEDYLRGCQLFNEEIAAEYESELQETTWNSFNENYSNLKKKPIKSENKHIVFNSDSEVEIDPDSDVDKKPSIKSLKLETDNLSKKRKRKSTSASESETEISSSSNKVKKVKIQENILLNSENNFEIPRTPSKKRKKNSDENNELFNNTEEQKFSDKKLPKTTFASSSTDTESEIPNSQDSKRKKKSNKDKIENNIKEEKSSKSKIKNLATEDKIEENKSNEVTEKKSKKHKKKKEDFADTEDERQHKQAIDKSLSNNLHLNSKNETEPSTSSKKKRKTSFLDDEILNDTEDERNYKKSLKKSFSELGQETVNEEIPKKKKKKHKDRKVSTEFIDDPTMDTEDERQYKSSLKELVQTITPGVDENNSESEFKVPKVKRLKKRRKSSHTETETSVHPSLVKVKDEPESETEEQRHMRRKKKKEEKLQLNSSSHTQEENNLSSLSNADEKPLNNGNLDDSVNHDANNSLLTEKLRHNVKSEEEQELRKKLKKEKRTKLSSK